LRYTASEAAELGVNVGPAIVHADFETAAHIAVKTVWPGCLMKYEISIFFVYTL